MGTPAKPAKKAAAKPAAKKAPAAPPTPAEDQAPPADSTPPAPPYNEVPPAAPVKPEPKVEAAAGDAPAPGSRADYVRALHEERGMCKAQGKADRLKAIDAEIKRVESLATRKAPTKDEA